MRGDGKTTKALEAIVSRARGGEMFAYVWPEWKSLFYPAQIVGRLAPDAKRTGHLGHTFIFEGFGRILIVPLCANPRRFAGTDFDIVLDHDCWNRPGADLNEMVRFKCDHDQRLSVRQTLKGESD